MFKLRESSDTFDWPVKAKIPSDNGKYKTVNFTATFRIPHADAVRDAFAADADHELRLKLIEESLVNIQGIPVVDDDDNEITDREKRCELALGSILLVGPITNSFVEGVTGYKSKN